MFDHGLDLQAISIPDPHPNKDHDIRPWLDEQIWGHRLWDSQSPWLLFLEFLTVAEACHREGRMLVDSESRYPLKFRPRQRLFLRTVVFNSEASARFADLYRDDKQAWAAWLKWMAEQAPRVIPERDFAYLQTRFHSFDEFLRVLQLLRSSAVERERNKRWSSRFVFPFGRNAIYEDLNITPSGTSASREYINFGRTGELLYLMLSRTVLRAELAPYVAAMFETDNAWNRLVGLLQPDDEGGKENQVWRGYSYLPYAQHPCFDRLAEDWLAIFRLRLPGFDAYPHLVTLGAFHVMLYHLMVSASWAGETRAPRLICEVVAPRKTLVRDLSFLSFAYNDALSGGAIERYIEIIRESSEWQQACAKPGQFVACRNLLEQKVYWGKEHPGPNEPEALLAELRIEALRRHRRHLASVHRSYGRDIGLVSRRGTNRLRYAPSDVLLKTLLLANVDRRMELGLFMQRLHERYGLIVGDREAEHALPSEEFDRKVFKSNAVRLEQRLGSMGLLRRLSDSCAYVVNPYGGAV